MKKIEVKNERFGCDYCNYSSRYKVDVEEHESLHLKVNSYIAGQKICYRATETTRIEHDDDIVVNKKGVVIKKDERKMRLLVELPDGERKWIEPWREYWDVL